MKIRWVIYNQFKVLLLFDGFVASIIKLEYDVFTIIQGFQCFKPNLYFLFLISGTFIHTIIYSWIMVFYLFYSDISNSISGGRFDLNYDYLLKYNLVSRIPVSTRNHTHSCFFMILTFMSLNLNLTQTRQTNWMESIRISIIISL